MPQTEYQNKLTSPKWQKKRLEVFQRDSFTCQRCDATEKTLHVHHKYYIKGKKPWEYPDDCYQTLCFECHEHIEQGLKFEADGTIQRLRHLGASGMEMMDFNIGLCLFDNCHEVIEWIHKWGLITALRDNGVDGVKMVSDLLNDKLKEFGYGTD